MKNNKEKLEVNQKIKDLNETLKRIKQELKFEMNNNEIETYSDTFGNKVSYNTQIRKSLQINKVKEYLDGDTLNKCYKETEFEIIRVVTPEQQERMKRFVVNK